MLILLETLNIYLTIDLPNFKYISSFSKIFVPSSNSNGKDWSSKAFSEMSFLSLLEIAKHKF